MRVVGGLALRQGLVRLLCWIVLEWLRLRLRMRARSAVGQVKSVWKPGGVVLRYWGIYRRLRCKAGRLVVESIIGAMSRRRRRGGIAWISHAAGWRGEHALTQTKASTHQRHPWRLWRLRGVQMPTLKPTGRSPCCSRHRRAQKRVRSFARSGRGQQQQPCSSRGVGCPGATAAGACRPGLRSGLRTAGAAAAAAGG